MEISAGRATSIDKLPGDQRQGSGEVVNEILHEINAPGGGGGIGDGTQIFQRQTDGLVASPNENFAPQTQSDMQEMQSQHMQQHQMQGPQSAAIEGEVYSQPPPSQPEGEIADAEHELNLPHPRTITPLSAAMMRGGATAETASSKFNLVSFAKTVLLFALIYMLFSLRYLKGWIGKIPTFSHEGGLSVVGTVVCAIVGGLIMGVVQIHV